MRACLKALDRARHIEKKARQLWDANGCVRDLDTATRRHACRAAKAAFYWTARATRTVEESYTREACDRAAEINAEAFNNLIAASRFFKHGEPRRRNRRGGHR